MSHFVCPLCGKQCSILHYDPTDFDDDILIIQKRGLGKGKGFEDVERYSLLDGSDPELLDLISDRVAVLYDLLYEDVKDDKAEADHSVDLEDEDKEEEVDFESLSELDKELFLAEQEEKDDEEKEKVDFESLSELDKELFLAEREEEEDEEEDEDINEVEEEIIA